MVQHSLTNWSFLLARLGPFVRCSIAVMSASEAMYPSDRGIRVLPQIDASDGYKYVSALYFSVSTLATVGFGEAGTLKNSVPATSARPRACSLNAH